jgi:hypothetical protein
MNRDMSFTSHNDYRLRFYKDVLKKVNFRVIPLFREDERSF